MEPAATEDALDDPVGASRGELEHSLAPGEPAAPWSLPEGILLAERYRVGAVLGRGGMGVVHRGHDLKLDVPVAIKVARTGGPADDVSRLRFEREARLGARLGDAPGFVRALDWGQADDVLFLVMELVDGAAPLNLFQGEVAERLDRLAEVAGLVADLHERGIIHRDLKPENVLQREDGSLLLADFGLSRVREAPREQRPIGAPGPTLPADEQLLATLMTQSGLGLGTPAYMPPEQFSAPEAVDERADVYALGAMVYQALASMLPFGDRAEAVLEAQASVRRGDEQLPRLRHEEPAGLVPKPVQRLCAEALALDPECRLESARALSDRLRSARSWVDDPRVVGSMAPGPAEHRLESARAHARARLMWGHDPAAIRLELERKRISAAEIDAIIGAGLRERSHIIRSLVAKEALAGGILIASGLVGFGLGRLLDYPFVGEALGFLGLVGGLLLLVRAGFTGMSSSAPSHVDM